MLPDVERAVAGFRIDGDLVGLQLCDTGHIHDTYIGSYRTGAGTARFVHQRINRSVFSSPEQLMENIERVTAHVQEKTSRAGGDPHRNVLSVVPAGDGCSFLRTAGGDYWRTFRFIEDAATCDRAGSPEMARTVAGAFSMFMLMVSDLPGEPLHETIPGFGDLPSRFHALHRAMEADPAGRAAMAAPEIRFALAREKNVGSFHALYTGGAVPRRIIHFDTKINNVMLDDHTGEAVCVIDLDTVMPGTILYDFGDCVRSGSTATGEDDDGKASFDIDLFEGIVSGYLEVARPFLVEAEVVHLAEAARVITLVSGVRFLTDYLIGDRYFRTSTEEQNLHRCRAQFAMTRRMEDQAGDMETIVERYG